MTIRQINHSVTGSQSSTNTGSRDTRPRRMQEEQLVHRQASASSRILYCGHSTQYSHLVGTVFTWWKTFLSAKQQCVHMEGKGINNTPARQGNLQYLKTYTRFIHA